MTIVGLLIYLLIAAIALGLAYYIINNILPEPMRRVATVILVVVCGIIVILLLVQFAGGSLPSLGHAIR